MDNENANEQAFPVAASWSDMQPQILTRQGGLTKREYFAAMFVQGILSRNAEIRPIDDKVITLGIKMADELLKQLSNSNNYASRISELEEGLKDLINQYEMVVTEKFNQLAIPCNLEDLPTLSKAKQLLNKHP